MTRTRQSAGVLVYRVRDRAVEVLLAHPGGPFWKNKDDGAWSIPKGEVEDDENLLDAARREFAEETGAQLRGEFYRLVPRRLRSGKLVHAFAIEHDLDVSQLRSNTFPMQWPPGSGRMQSFPEVDRFAWYSLADAVRKINVGQQPFLRELADMLAS